MDAAVEEAHAKNRAGRKKRRRWKCSSCATRRGSHHLLPEVRSEFVDAMAAWPSMMPADAVADFVRRLNRRAGDESRHRRHNAHAGIDRVCLFLAKAALVGMVA